MNRLMRTLFLSAVRRVQEAGSVPKYVDITAEISIIILRMLTEVHEFAYAKVNLGLRVLPRRADGFHGIEGIFQTVGLADELIVRLTDGYGGCDVSCEGFPLPQENTVVSAYRAFCSSTGERVRSVRVEVIKHIPAGGGLGGGSSDAAALVRALRKLNGITLCGSQLDRIAAEVGSDVFFFLHCDETGGGCAVVSGRGEIVRNIRRRPDICFVLVFPDVHSSTRDAYALVDGQLAAEDGGTYPAFGSLESVYRSSVSEWNFVNSFTPVMTAAYPEIDKALQGVRGSGALYSEMSGSGATVFGVFVSEKEARNAADVLANRGFRCAVAR
ncbi:MAG: 4-(cytidine 5'-diphospho)-2-C-methyl-D-erythritol kinase [Treponemataceae bacterium]|nr:4-(cytidine 5'-diphospho)-2-C-methyl-D-erythritol kinase [Treponemataceae bacterium]